MAPPIFWWGSDAPEPLFGETLDPPEKTLAFPSTAGTGVERGYLSGSFCLVGLG